MLSKIFNNLEAVEILEIYEKLNDIEVFPQYLLYQFDILQLNISDLKS